MKAQSGYGAPMNRIALFSLALFFSGCLPSLEAKSAGQVGCPPAEIKTSNEETDFGLGQGSRTWSAECRGRRFICSETITSTKDASSSQISCSPETGAQPSGSQTGSSTPATTAQSDSPPPGKAAAGFEFGASPDTLKELCEKSSKQWTTLDASHAKCSGPLVDLGFPAEVELTFANDRASAITIVHTPDSRWMARLMELKDTLGKKYGESRQSVKLPSSCHSESEFVGCLKNGEASMEYLWSWRSGEKVLLAAGRRKGTENEPVILIRYSRPASKVEPAGL
jgi:hypothetical protein